MILADRSTLGRFKNTILKSLLFKRSRLVKINAQDWSEAWKISLKLSEMKKRWIFSVRWQFFWIFCFELVSKSGEISFQWHFNRTIFQLSSAKLQLDAPFDQLSRSPTWWGWKVTRPRPQPGPSGSVQPLHPPWGRPCLSPSHPTSWATSWPPISRSCLKSVLQILVL